MSRSEQWACLTSSVPTPGAVTEVLASDVPPILRDPAALKAQLLRLKAEAEAGSRVVDVLVRQGASLRVERDAVRIVSRSAMNAALSMRSDHADLSRTLVAEKLAWKAIANACLQIAQNSRSSNLTPPLPSATAPLTTELEEDIVIIETAELAEDSVLSRHQSDVVQVVQDAELLELFEDPTPSHPVAAADIRDSSLSLH